MGKYFGTDGFRGKAFTELTEEHAYHIGVFLGNYFKKENREAKVMIGRDTRVSSPILEKRLIDGLLFSNAHVFSLGVASTPCVSFMVVEEKCDCGIIISASHNPYEDNGIKIVNHKGEKLEEEIILKLEDYLDGNKDILASKNNGILEICSCQKYIEKRKSLIDFDLSNLSIALDLANGATSSIAKEVFKSYSVHYLFDSPDGKNINENCGSTHIEALQQYVKEHHLDAGFAFDGDGDRCIAVDENGDVLDGDLILYILGKYLKEKGLLNQNTIVATVMSNQGLLDALKEEGISYHLTPVGDKYVYQEMVNHNFSLGGEQSGHIIIRDDSPFGDGILTALMLLKVRVESKKSFSKLHESFTIYPQTLINIKVSNKESVMKDSLLKEKLEEISQTYGDPVRVLVRPSGTENLIRIMVMAKERELCDSISSIFVKLVAPYEVK